MSLNISKTQSAMVWKIEDRGTYAIVDLSTSEFNKTTEERLYSSWGFVRFVGQAYGKISELGLKERDVIVLHGAKISRAPYVKDGEKIYPKNVQITVFDWEHYVPGEGTTTGLDTPPQVEDDDEVPF